MPHSTVYKHLLHRIGDEGVCSVRKEPSERGILTRNTRRARVLFFFDPATPMRASTSAFRSFKMPTQSTLETDNDRTQLQDNTTKTKMTNDRKLTYASVMLVLESRDTSMTVVPSMSTSLQAVVLRPVTLHAW